MLHIKSDYEDFQKEFIFETNSDIAQKSIKLHQRYSLVFRQESSVEQEEVGKKKFPQFQCV